MFACGVCTAGGRTSCPPAPLDPCDSNVTSAGALSEVHWYKKERLSHKHCVCRQHSPSPKRTFASQDICGQNARAKHNNMTPLMLKADELLY
jgi:hypothetical protein